MSVVVVVVQAEPRYAKKFRCGNVTFEGLEIDLPHLTKIRFLHREVRTKKRQSAFNKAVVRHKESSLY